MHSIAFYKTFLMICLDPDMGQFINGCYVFVCRYVLGTVHNVETVTNYHVLFDDGTECSEITLTDIVEVLCVWVWVCVIVCVGSIQPCPRLQVAHSLV